MYYKLALNEGVAVTGSEIPWLLPSLASSPPGLEVDFSYVFEIYDELPDTAYNDTSAYIAIAHIYILYGGAGVILSDYHHLYYDPTHESTAYFEDLLYDPETYADTARVFAIMGIAHRETGDYDRTLADFDKAIELDSQSKRFYEDRGIAHYLNGNYNRAITDLDTAISTLPDDAYLYLFRALAYHMKEEHDGAVSDYDRAIAINPDDPYLHFFRSAVLEALGEENEHEKYMTLLEDEYDLQLALRLLLPPLGSESQAAAAD